jgi:hypothetical protein
MSAASTSEKRFRGLPEELRIAQEAIDLPEVQEMLRKLADHNLGIYMPHMHNERTGAFEPLPSGIRQVEDGLRVSFKPDGECIDSPERSYLPVGWYWNAGTSSYCSQVCGMSCVVTAGIHNTTHPQSHTQS